MLRVEYGDKESVRGRSYNREENLWHSQEQIFVWFSSHTGKEEIMIQRKIDSH